MRKLEKPFLKPSCRLETVPLLHTLSQKDPSCYIPPQLLGYFLDLCPVADGPLYEHYVFRSLLCLLGHIIDAEYSKQQYKVPGRKIDVLLPFRTEQLHKHQFWESWYHRYRIRGFPVEVKNLTGRAKPDNVGQLFHYLSLAEMGHCGFLISRNGFDVSTFEVIKEHLNKEILVLPLDNDDLKQLLALVSDGPEKIFRFLCRKERLIHRQ